ncbi:MAG TPA: PepSY-associated TM helix domain-containing protein, partial [Pseudomonadales bacterium]|nr:PepSY-associated TM helix domain-containing protein [Pseudomonadales bacterium]
MRQLLVLLHRWFGLFTAVFLFISGLTGAIISWDHELDEWLNPALFNSDTPGERQPPLVLANQLEAIDPRLQISFLPLHHEEGHALTVFVDRLIEPTTGRLYDTGFNQLGLNPVAGAVQDSREWGVISLSRENLLPFLYKLHYSMHIPDGFTIE